MKSYSVYFTQNLLDPAKAYIGMTNGNVKNYLGSDKKLKKDVTLLGRHNFSRIILGTFNNYKECHYWEGFYIRTLKTHVSQGGYNESWSGGGYNPNNPKGFKGKKHTPQAKKKIIAALIDRPCSKETREKIAAPQRGKSISEESKKKNRLAHLGKSTWNAGMRGIYKFPNRKKEEKIYCDHCKRFIAKHNYIKRHGDNCKMNQNI